MGSIWDCDDIPKITKELIDRIKEKKYRHSAVDNLIKALVISIKEREEESNKKAKEFLDSFSKDYSEESEKPDLVPRNNREYWLFTEVYQKLKDFFVAIQ